LAKGFRGQSWDGGDVAHNPETWARLAEHLYPGAFGIAFSSARTVHKMMTAIEDAGMILYPAIFGWLYTSGFPKAHAAQDYPGYAYGAGVLKPAIEPIVIFQKPFSGPMRINLPLHGTGLMDIDGARVGKTEVKINRFNDGMKPFGEGAGHNYHSVTKTGRWPANFLYLHHPDCNELQCAPGCFARRYNPAIADCFHAFPFRNLAESAPVLSYKKPNQTERNAGLNGKNPHPTVKPMALAAHLAKLILPPGKFAPRRLLVPFSGSGSEMMGAMTAGWDFIQGVELSAEYAEVANKRIDNLIRNGLRVQL